LYFAFLPVYLSWPSALLLCLAHELFLSHRVAEWILNPSTQRLDFISSNREGIFSIHGYVALHLAGVAFGAMIFKREEGEENTFARALSQCKRLFLWALIMWASLYYSQRELFMQPSRRLANWNYFNWMVAYNVSLLAVFLATDLLIFKARHSREQSSTKGNGNKHHSRGRKAKQASSSSSSSNASKKGSTCSSSSPIPYLDVRVPFLFRVVNTNGLAFFLLANVMTGVVNLSVDTAKVSGCPAVLALALYAFLLHLVAINLHQRGVRLKGW